MSFINGLFALPIIPALQAYRQAHYEWPVYRTNPFTGLEKISKSDPEYAWRLSLCSSDRLKSEMKPFLDEVGVRADLIFAETVNLGFCSASGTNMFRSSDAVVQIAPYFYAADKDACSWVIKHEISHIKHNDAFTIHAVPCICQLAAAIFGMCFLPLSSAVMVACMVGLVSQVLFLQWREMKADDFAIKHSSNEELKGGRRFLMALREINIEQRDTFWGRIRMSASGENRLDIFHPSLTSRIQKIERALQARSSNIDVAEERRRLGEFKAYMRTALCDIGAFVKRAGGIVGLIKNALSH